MERINIWGGGNSALFRVSAPELWIYNPIIFGLDSDFTSLVWRMDVESVGSYYIRELVLVDAKLGSVALHFNKVDSAKDREVYTAWNGSDCTNTIPGWLQRIEGQVPTGYTDVDNAYNYSGLTYDFYLNEHGRDSINNAGMTIISTVDYDEDGGCNYQNAFWNGNQMVYGSGFTSALDVVGHELTHGVTDYESNLFYYMQSGAINEAFSDIWGEFIELSYEPGPPSDRWKIGEDLPIGAIRNMEDPTISGDPDKMTSVNYYCGEGDNGGVHTNSGIANKAAYLMADGGTFNGYTVSGMGISKTADLFYDVQTNMFTSAGDYADLYDSLQQAAINLGYNASDQQTVIDAVNATEMNQQPTSCTAYEAPICDIGSPNNLFFDDMENPGSGNWASEAIVGSNAWYYPQNSHPYVGFDATYATSGIYNIWGYNYYNTADYYIAMTLDIFLPANAYLHFNHSYAFDNSWTIMFDGGVIEYSIDSGSTWIDAGPLITHNGYDGTIASFWGNPLGGRQAFGRDSNGYISTRLDLSSLEGNNIRFRFRIGTDNEYDDYGWFVDDFRIYTCVTEPSIISYAPETPVNVTEGETITFNITIDQVVNVSWQINGTEVQTNTSVTEASYTNTSAAIGIWNVSAIASNENGTDMQTWVWNVTSANQPPIASFTYTPENLIINGAITFNASASYDPDGSIVNYTWNFNDGNITDTTDPIITHSYTSAGDYSVNLIVTDDEGAMNTTSTTIEVINVKPLPGYTDPPTDPDEDGLYEDLNGNGLIDFNDVVLYFQYMEWIEENEPCIVCFDFNGNDLVDFDDLVKLFEEV